MALGLWFGQFHVIDRDVREDGPFVGVFEGTGTAAGVGVYVVAEPVGAATARLCNDVLEVISRAFGQPEQALTANLLRALSAGHQHVRDWNRLHTGDRVSGVGISCLATRGEEGYLAQCGPSLTIAQTAGRFRVSAPAGDDSRRPLGLGDRAAPVFTRLSLHPGDVVMLLFSAADRLVDRGSLINLVMSPPEESLPALYTRVRASPAFAALYLGVIEQPAQPAAPPQPPAAGRPAPRAVSAPAYRESDAAAPAVSPAAHAPAAAPSAANGGFGAPADTGGYASPSFRFPPGHRASMGSLGSGARLPSRRFWLTLAAIAAALILIFIAVPALARRGNDDRYQQLVHSADVDLASAGQTQDAATRRTLLNHAQADLLEARQIRPESADVGERLDRVGADLAALDSSHELADLTQVADLSEAGVGAQAALEIAVAGGRVYLLDVAAGKVLGLSGKVGERADVVFEEGRGVGSEKTGKARHLTLVPGATGAPVTLLVLDANRRLFATAPDGSWRAVALAGADSWKSDTAIAATGGALYVLDAAAEQVWRYSATPAGYEDKPEPLIARAQLKDGVALTIGGTPVVATGGSRLLRIVDGHDEELKPSGLDRPLVAPTAPIFNPRDSLYYVADRGNQRIVLIDGAGAFHEQLVHRRFMALRAIALDDERGLLYAVSGQALLSAPLTR